jgi:hypothetical protein
MTSLRSVALTSTLLTATALLLVPGQGSASEPAPTAAQERIHLAVLPPIVQPGRRVASPDAARAAVTVTVQPGTVGRKVRLQALRGSSWVTVARARQDAQGRAQFAARVSRNGQPVTYRARASAFGGLPAIKSDRVSTGRWLTPTFTDRFSGRTLSSAWANRGRSYEPQSLRRCSKGSGKAVSVGGGVVRLSVIRDRSRLTRCPALKKGKIAGRYAYRLNGHIGTDQTFSFTYGFAAARIRFPQLRGQHGSFWLQPVGGMYPGGTGHEIDVCEFFGESHGRGTLYSFIHRYQAGRIVKTGARIPDTFLHGAGDGWGTRFHVFSVQWTPTSLVFRVDGRQTWRIGGRISHVPQYLNLSLLSSDYELPLIQDRQLPQHMDVDWVRVWETGR